MNEKQLRDIDHAILKHIEEGRNDTQKITEATTLKTHQVRYSLKKLEQQGLIKLEKPEGTVERVINGQKRVFQAPHRAELTEQGFQQMAASDQATSGNYENLSHGELVEKIHQLEGEVNELKRSLESFRRQVKERL